MAQIKIAVLYSQLSGYMASCLKKLKEEFEVELLVYSWPPSSNAPFDDEIFNFIDHQFTKKKGDASQIYDKLTNFNPDAIFMSGWMDKDYLKVARKIRKNHVFVIAGCDTQIDNSIRQKIGSIISPYYLHSAIDVLWVSGERQRLLAQKLDFTGPKCWDGVYSCDWGKFSLCSQINKSNNNSFLFIGRYVKNKGISVLVEAYKRYRMQVNNPWELICAGKGPLDYLLNNQQGIENIGFVQPHDLADLFSKASVFVLPSIKEPWGVVIHEAVTSGLPLICSSACGATTAFLRDGYNGYLVEPNNIDHLVKNLKNMHELTEKNYNKMCKRSFNLSKQITPELWSNTIVSGVHEFKNSI